MVRANCPHFCFRQYQIGPVLHRANCEQLQVDQAESKPLSIAGPQGQAGC